MEPKRRALETGERVHEEVTYELPSGQVSYDLTVVPLRDETGTIVGLTAASLDITEQKQRERHLEEYRRQCRTLIENVPSGAVALVDQDLQYVAFGGTPEGETDVTRADLEGNPFVMSYHRKSWRWSSPVRSGSRRRGVGVRGYNRRAGLPVPLRPGP